MSWYHKGLCPCTPYTHDCTPPTHPWDQPDRGFRRGYIRGAPAHGDSADRRLSDCAVPSSSVHSRYQRRLTDLPWGTRAVHIQLIARTCFCRNRACVCRIFTERLPDVAAPYARNTFGRNAPCWCGSGQKYKKCHLPLEPR
jgi:hypothetical protein